MITTLFITLIDRTFVVADLDNTIYEALKKYDFVEIWVLTIQEDWDDLGRRYLRDPGRIRVVNRVGIPLLPWEQKK